jgi:hypothetical protein
MFSVMRCKRKTTFLKFLYLLVVRKTKENGVISKLSKLGQDEHVFRIRDNNSTVQRTSGATQSMSSIYAVGEFGGKEVFLNASKVVNMSNGKDNNTVPHELGHTGWLIHADQAPSAVSNQWASAWATLTGQGNISPSGANLYNAMFSGANIASDIKSTELNQNQLLSLIKAMNGGGISVNRETINGKIDDSYTR